ncbi:MAG: 16S rRNA (guanine(966)-N(2))-methyltransferase RsmD [Acidimicrobiia bacterium]
MAGSARGRTLVAPSGSTTRPTGDKVRQAMFNSLESFDLIDGARLLDLFAGSGALGIEGLSRGAAHCTFVEPDRSARVCLEKNLTTVAGSLGKVSTMVVTSSAERFLDANRERFDVALLDPPYAFEGWDELLDRLPSDVAVIESNRPVTVRAGWEILREKSYGGTVVVFAGRKHPNADPTPE